VITKEQVLDMLKTVVDPEIGINIVDLGLIYKIEIKDDVVNIDMTLTVPGCPLASMLTQVAKQRVEMMDEVKKANINLVWEPKWTPSMASDEVKKRFGIT